MTVVRDSRPSEASGGGLPSRPPRRAAAQETDHDRQIRHRIPAAAIARVSSSTCTVHEHVQVYM